MHLVTDWPGYFPNGPQIVRLLIGAGADPNALTSGRDSPGKGDETPLHYAASSDDVDVAEALIDGGADLETPDGSIGTPLDNAVGVQTCWRVLPAFWSGTDSARVDKAWHASALGMLSRLEAILGNEPPEEDVSQAFWHACAGGQRRAAEYLLSRGADINWQPDYAYGTALDAADGQGTPAGERHFLAARIGSASRGLRLTPAKRGYLATEPAVAVGRIYALMAQATLSADHATRR